ncbi:hypothetical protein CK203_023530 [Vitis vinifera]|uniref:Uncharacterized protein n=1 Tax=Vitis vinifera TaxID=29760 RepID=A0A438JBV5_VITVI|nr:hypothetical protein CK203_023530 [Vitis vinifera]
MSLFGRGLLLGSIGRGRGAGVLRKVGMVLGLGCGGPSRVGGTSLTKELSMWGMIGSWKGSKSLSRLYGKNEDDRLDWLYAKKGKCKSFYSFGAGKNGYLPLEDYLEPDGLDQSRFFYMGSFLVKDFDKRKRPLTTFSFITPKLKAYRVWYYPCLELCE